jgi:hypothetical protein
MLVSAMTNRFGYRKITILGAIVTAVGFFLSSFATEIYHLYIRRKSKDWLARDQANVSECGDMSFRELLFQ